MNQFIVRLEAGVFLADAQGDPGRTLVYENAKRFDSHKAAKCAIAAARRRRPFQNARVLGVPGTNA